MLMHARRRHRSPIRVAAAVAAAVVTALVIAVGRAQLDAPAPQAAVLVTAARPSVPARAADTAPPQRAVAPTPPTTVPAPTTRTTPSVPKTTTTVPASPRTTTTVRTRATCLALAEANHYAVVAANYEWFREQVRNLSPDQAVAAGQYDALRIEESWALQEIDAQYAIDRSNCYLGGEQ